MRVHLRPSKASSVIAAPDDEPANEVARCIATMGPVTPDVIAIVAEVPKQRFGTVISQDKSTDNVSGNQSLVAIITRADVEGKMLDGLETLDPELVGKLYARMPINMDILKLERRDIQEIPITKRAPSAKGRSATAW